MSTAAPGGRAGLAATPRERGAPRSGRVGVAVGVTVVVAVVLAFLLVPIVALFTYQPVGDLIDGFGTKVATDAIVVSLKTNAIAFALMIALGTPFAYIVGRSRFRGRSLVITLVELPLVMPPAVAGLALLVAFGRLGLLGHTFSVLGIDLAFTPGGGGDRDPVRRQPVLSARRDRRVRGASMRRCSTSPGRSARARSDGCCGSRCRSPAAALGAAAAVAFARGIGEFGATILFAGSFQGTTQTLPLAVYSLFDANLDQAVAIGVLLIIVSAAILLTSKLLVRSWTSSKSTSRSPGGRSIFAPR